MTQIITRPATSVKTTRPARPFGDGILTDDTCLSDADAAVKSGLASRRPTPEGRGLTAAEARRVTAAENAARHGVECRALGNDEETARAVSEACRRARREELAAILRDRRGAPIPRGFRDAATRLYVPSAAEELWLADSGCYDDAGIMAVGPC